LNCKQALLASEVFLLVYLQIFSAVHFKYYPSVTFVVLQVQKFQRQISLRAYLFFPATNDGKSRIFLSSELQGMKVYSLNGCRFLYIVNFDTRVGVSMTLRPFNQRGKKPWYYLHKQFIEAESQAE